MNKELTVTLYVGGKQVETLTEEQKEKMAQRLSESMSHYYSANLEEFQRIEEK